MGSLKSFKDIKAWQTGIELARAVYRVSGKGPFSKDYPLRNQIRAAAISISSNIAEGFEREGNKEFIQFLTIAKGSTAEVQTQLRIAFDAGFITKKEFKHMESLCIEILSLTSGFLRYLRSSGIRGNKFKRAKTSNAQR